MTENLLDLWKNSLNLIKTELTDVSFNTWFKPVKPIAMNGQTIILLTPNEFAKGILESRYSNLIINAVKEITSKDYELEFILPGSEQYFRISQSNPQNTNKEVFDDLNLNPKYVFDTFVIGNSNRFAHAASLAVAEAPAKAYNPLFIYGGVGLGKPI